MNANEKVTTATKLKSRVIKYPLFETRVCVLQRIGRATIKDEFFLSKIAVSNYQFSTLYHRNILIQLIFIKRVFLFHRFRKKISTVSFSIFIFYGTSRNQRQQTAFYNYRATFYNVLAVNCSNDKKINWKSIGKLCNVRGYLLRDRIVFASKNIERVYTISGLFRVANIKSKVGIFCPVKERINHSAHGEFNLSLLPLITIPRKQEDATLSKNAEITCGCAMRDASTCEYIALPCFRTNYRGLCDFLAAPLQPILFKISVLN